MLVQLYIPIILSIVLSDLYLYYRIFRRKRSKGKMPWIRLAAVVIPSAVMIAYTGWLFLQRSFAPGNVGVLNVYR